MKHSLIVTFRNVPIHRKLFFIVALSTAAALLVMAMTTLFQQWLYYRGELMESVKSETLLLSANSAAALLFNDKKAATETLATLSSIDNITFAMLHDRDGQLFAIYLRQGEKETSPHLHNIQDSFNYQFSATRLDYFVPISVRGEMIGTAHVQSDLYPLYKNIAWSAGFLFVATLLGLVIALFMVTRLHPAITAPIGKLLNLMKKVSQQRNYALRAEIYSTDELGELADGFNDMLARVQRRDMELEQHRANLEQDVTQRTIDLQVANERLGHELAERRRVEKEINRLNQVLEQRVRERTQQLVETQEELLRKEKLSTLGQVAGSVGHELRNPLGVMSNAVYFLQTVLPDSDETTKEYLGIIRDEILNADRIVSDLLDSVRTKSPQTQRVVIWILINQILRKISIPAGINVAFNLATTLPAIRVDPVQVQQVFRNLISNAIDAMPNGGTLDISASVDAAKNNLVVKVQDSGIGISRENMAKLFQPLFTTKARGIGLGLVMVKNLVENNGGKVAVESKPGNGSTFSVTFPLAEESS